MALSVEAIHARSVAAVQERDERDRLQLQRMERALVRARLAQPAALAREDYETLRYAIGLARLHRFRPYGADADVTVNSTLVAPLRHWLLDNLYNVLRDGSSGAVDKLSLCRQAVPEVRGRATRQRHRLLQAHGNDFSAAALDHEAGQRALVMVAGGGGGAAYVYVGAFACLMDNGLVPDYIVGNSMGSILGSVRAFQRRADVQEYLEFARNLKNRDIFTAGRHHAEFCLPGLLHLHLQAVHERMQIGELGRPACLADMEIPLDVVVAGVRRRPYSRLPEEVREPGSAGSRMLPLSLRVAGRLSRLLSFVNSDVVEPVVLGRDDDTRQIHAVDAAGFSAAVPTILQYEPGPTAGVTREIFADLMQQRDLVALVDGGVADNVPMRSAWQGVAQGRAGGTRNAYYLAFDCFHPRIGPKNIWLWPIMQTLQMQMRTNRPYADMLIRFNPTLSPLNIVPGEKAFDLSVKWGYEQMEARLPEVRETMRPVALTRRPELLARAS